VRSRAGSFGYSFRQFGIYDKMKIILEIILYPLIADRLRRFFTRNGLESRVRGSVHGSIGAAVISLGLECMAVFCVPGSWCLFLPVCFSYKSVTATKFV